MIRQPLNIMALFLIVQFAGLLLAILTIAPVPVPVVSSNSPSSVFSFSLIFIFEIIVITAIILFIFSRYKGNWGFIILEIVAVGFGTAFFFYLVIGTLFPNANLSYITGAAIAITAILIIAKNKQPKLRNLLALTATTGLGIGGGLLGFSYAYVIMALMAAYDYIAVFITKHMITLANLVASKNLSILIGSSDVEAIPNKYLTKKDLANFRQEIKKNPIKDPVVNEVVEGGSVPVMSRVMLGGGDLALPLFLSVGAYVTFLDYIVPVMATVGAGFGMLFTMYLLKKYKVALPAIPPLFAFMNLFLGIAVLTSGKGTLIFSASFIVIFILTILALLLKLRESSVK